MEHLIIVQTFIAPYMMKILDCAPMQMSKLLLHHCVGHVITCCYMIFLKIVVSIYTGQLETLNDVIICVIIRRARAFMKRIPLLESALSGGADQYANDGKSTNIPGSTSTQPKKACFRTLGGLHKPH